MDWLCATLELLRKGVFLMDGVPEAERNAVARQVADAIIDSIEREGLADPRAA